MFYIGGIIDFTVHSCAKTIVKAFYYFKDVTFTIIHRKTHFFKTDPLCCRSFLI